ncbi:exonuclease subunit SbcD [Corynebacterium occultum]|uniref:Nuclease SbcCD subunit D n=1 Tax=Corynebacterium occultum TaxID=2675219 RepID=A0A6B8W6V7_9CORY|nr:exonuclease SbcCD subunit D [Corynebacterium occultum]QGU07055.1 exonuclease subunit SbcD [Corynebacterium occultum]
MSRVADRTGGMSFSDAAPVKFLHTSDLQIGMDRHFLDADAQARFNDARIRAISRCGEVALAHGCAFIVVAGDVFEKNSLSAQTTSRALEALRQLPLPVYLLPGNHDPLVADSIFYRTADIAGVHVLGDSEPVEVSPGVEVVGAPLKSRYATTDLVRQALEPLAPYEGVRIMVGHGQAFSRTSEASPDLIDLAYVESRLADGSIDYLALGDTHSAQAVGDSGRVWFSGAPETTDFHDLTPGVEGGEVNSGKVLVVTAYPGSVTVEEVAVGQWTFHALHADLYSTGDVEEFLTRLAAYPDKATTVIKYALHGTLGLGDHRLLSAGLEDLRPAFAALYERTRLMDLQLEPGAEEIVELDIQGYAAAALDELVQRREEPAARDALNLLFRLSKES